MSIKQEIIDFMAARPDETTFLRSEFTEALTACSRAGIDRAIKQMVDEGNLVRLGYGIVARSERRLNSITGKPSVFLEKPFRACVKEALDKLGVPNRLDSASRAYNERRTTQVPAWTAFDIGNSRFSRKITVNGRGTPVFFERSKEKKEGNMKEERVPVQRPNLDIPADADMGEFIIQLAREYELDWVTGDEADDNDIQAMLVALRRERIIDGVAMIELLARYLYARRNPGSPIPESTLDFFVSWIMAEWGFTYSMPDGDRFRGMLDALRQRNIINDLDDFSELMTRYQAEIGGSE